MWAFFALRQADVGQQYSQIYILQQMQAEKKQKKINCIEVKGMNGLSIPYIKRFFSHVGYVEEVKKSNDRVVVRFRFPSSINKAFRFNGRVIEKDPLIIRNLSASTPAEQIPMTKLPKSHNIREINDKISDRIKYGPLDLPYHWMKVERILGNVEDDELRWLIYELFIQKMIKIFTLYLTGNNSRSKYHQYVLMEMILIHKKKINSLSGSHNSSTEKLEYTSSIPRDLQYQATFDAWNNQLESRIRHRFISMRNQGEGLNLYFLYMLFYKNSLKLEQDIKLVSQKQESADLGEKRKKITLNNINKIRYEVCIEQWIPKVAERSEYRSIDIEHPSKQIQVFSDSYFHEGPSSAFVFQIFLDGFDGCVNNSYSENIFHEFRPFFTPNCLLIKHTDSRKNSYERLFYELRILNCSSEKFQEKQYLKIYTFKTDSQILSAHFEDEQKFCAQFNEIVRISETKLQKHNLVIGYWEDPELFLYNIEEYLDYYCSSNEAETDSEYSRPLSVFIICTNTEPKQMQKISVLIQKWKQNQKIMNSKATLYFLFVFDHYKFQKQKVRHYLEEQVDNMIKSPMNIDIARMRAKQFLIETPDKFQGISEPEKFITNTIWELYEQRGRRLAKNQILECSYKIRK